LEPAWNVAGGDGVGPGFGGVGEVFAIEGLGDEEGGADAAVGDDEGPGDDGAGGADVEDGLDAFGLYPVGADGLAGDADGLHEADDFDFLIRRNDGALGFEGFAVDGGVDDGVAGDVELVALNDDAEAGEDDGGVDAGGGGGDAEDVLAVDFLGGGALGDDGAARRVDGFDLLVEDVAGHGGAPGGFGWQG